MKTRRLVTSVLAIAVVLGAGNVPNALAQTPTQSQTASELLQKGIYLQETVGDLDGAIKVYQQITRMADEPRASGAQAEYRLGLCLQKKGREAEANKAFQNLIAKYPDQPEVVSQARAFIAAAAQPKLLPAPWKDGEALELFAKFPTGMLLLVIRYSIVSSKTNPGHWLLEDNWSNPGIQFQTQVEVDSETMKPVSSSGTNPYWGDMQITYQGSEARMGKETTKIALDGPIWDNEEVWALLRRLPLAPGYKTTLPILSRTGMPQKIDFAVTGTEDIKTPAGAFHCYRVEAERLRQTFFISTDDSRYLVKIELPGLVGGGAELERVSHGPAGPVAYTDNKLGFSLNAPEGWRVYNFSPEEEDLDEPASSPTGTVKAEPESGFMHDSGASQAAAKPSSKPAKKKATERSVSAIASLVDPDSLVPIMLTVNTFGADYPATAEGMREHIQKDIDKDTTKTAKTVRADSWQTRQIAGRLAISWLVDYTDLFGRKSTDYSMEIRGDKTRARFTSKLASDSDLAAFEKRFDPIMANLTIK